MSGKQFRPLFGPFFQTISWAQNFHSKQGLFSALEELGKSIWLKQQKVDKIKVFKMVGTKMVGTKNGS